MGKLLDQAVNLAVKGHFTKNKRGGATMHHPFKSVRAITRKPRPVI